MLLTNPKNPFTILMISVMPPEPGVYTLWNGNDLLYIGAAENVDGIRGEFECLYRGEHTLTIDTISHFQIEPCQDPSKHQNELIIKYMKKHWQNPPHNQIIISNEI